MFEYIRTHQRIMQLLLLLIIFPSFAFFGIDSFMRASSSDNAVAKVAGHTISQQEFDNAQREQLDRLRQMYGQQFDSKMLSTPQAKQGILDELISRKAMSLEVISKKLTVTDQTLQQNILSTPGLAKADGSFDADRYKGLLAAQGMTPAMYEQRLRQDLALQQLVNAVQGTAILPKAVAESVALIYEQEREVQKLEFKAADFAANVKLTDAMLQAYYDKNTAQFEIPESVSAEYVVLSDEMLSAQITVSDADVAAHYEQNKKAYATQEQRRASHILINAKKDASASEITAAKTKAEGLLAQVKAKPELFAKLAKENSQDPGSAERGGDVEFFARGAMVKPFEDAAFNLKKNEISGLVQTDYGFHIILLTDTKPASVQPLDEVKVQIVADIKKQKAAKLYAEAAETFTNTVYEQSDSLKAVVEKLKLKVETTQSLSRQVNPALPASLVYNNPKFLKAIFSEDSLKKKQNTEALEVAPHTLVAGRVVTYKPAAKRPFEQVKAEIAARVTQAEALALARTAGQAKLKDLKTADSNTGFSEAKQISRLKNQDVDGVAFAALMKADVTKLPAFVGVELPNNAYAVYRINKITAGAADASRRASEAQQIANLMAQQDVYTYIETLKKKSKVTINKAALSLPANAAE